jgi:hypothetical protein
VIGAFERNRRAIEGKRRGGGRLGATWGRERSGEGGDGVWCCVSWHGMGAVAPGRSDSSRRRTSRGRGGRVRTGEAAGTRNAGTMADKWGVTTEGPVGSGWVREGEAARRDADTQTRQHSAGRREFKWDSKQFQTDSNLPQTLTDPKGAFLCSIKLEIKYGWKDLETRNNFHYRNFSRFEMEFELKIRKLL